MSVDGFILTGGASTRMGSDKAQLLSGSLTSVQRIARALSVIAIRVSTVGRAGARSSDAFAHVIDVHPGWGALGGIHAALHACQSEWAAVVACDLPLVTSELFLRLRSLTHNSEPRTYDAVVPIQLDGRPQPLCALYRRESCLQKSEALIASGEHTPRALLAAVSTRWVRSEELSDLPGADHFFLNVNSPEDYLRAKTILASTR